MDSCPCACHIGPYASCDQPGGCGFLHRTEGLPDLRALSGLGDRQQTQVLLSTSGAESSAEQPAKSKVGTRPTWACAIHLPPRPGCDWREADGGYRTCSGCYDRLHKWLSPFGKDEEGRPDNIPILYLLLDPRLGNGAGTGRRSPGFGSRSPGSDHVIAMRDVRTVQVDEKDPWSAAALLRSWVLWVWDERYDDAALNEPSYHQRRRELPTTVIDSARWLDRQLDWLTRNEIITEFHAELRELRRKLRGATGEGGQRPVGHCFEILADGECRTAIYMPKGEQPRAPDEPITTLPELRCPTCDSSYTGRRLILLKIAEEKAAKAAAGAGDTAA